MKLTLLIPLAVLVSVSTFSHADDFSGLRIELQKTGYFSSDKLDNDEKIDAAKGYGLLAGYDLNRIHDFTFSASRLDGDLKGTDNLNIKGNVYKAAWNMGYTFSVPGVLDIKPYGTFGWSMVDGTSDGKNEKISDKENGFVYGVGVRAIIIGDFALSADWSRSKLYGAKMDTITLGAGFKF